MALQVTDITPSDQLKPVGNVVLVVVDIQGGGLENPFTPSKPEQTFMPGRPERNAAAVTLVEAFRAAQVPVVFIQEVHKPSLVDIGRELDGNEGPHCIEGEPATELHPGLDPRPDEYLIKKRRYSAFYGTELDIVLRGYKAETVILIGGMTDVCIHYTAVDAHQYDYHIRTVSDLVVGSGQELHDAALRAIKYLQRDALVSSDAVYTWLGEQK
ncbi:cysteine hydrolase family protein [Actinoplanes derwentensis]|uniref:Nicotinamidase-related amidase n=1 Tax=Actinoplanes derwentensis TaxID=113562 RepID=A0A1H1URB8_9ACTN|nr:isochorismatase family cysteine hydrolase [Actinoplanes derwentensis]SDS75062.1 Nicotinamidase-related amidase [Actinoplanes derwentensis]